MASKKSKLNQHIRSHFAAGNLALDLCDAAQKRAQKHRRGKAGRVAAVAYRDLSRIVSELRERAKLEMDGAR